MFRVIWRTVNILLIVSLLFLGHSAAWEYSVRRYLKGFSDAVVPSGATPEEKIDAILSWMRSGPPRTVAVDPDNLAIRNPEVTLNYRQLLGVCGTATNAFLNLSRSAGLTARRLLLLSPQHFANHVVAEVLVDGRWIIVDPTFRLILRDAQGHTLTRQELRDPEVFDQATGHIPELSILLQLPAGRARSCCPPAHCRFRSPYRSPAHLSYLGRKRGVEPASRARIFLFLLRFRFCICVFLYSSPAAGLVRRSPLARSAFPPAQPHLPRGRHFFFHSGD